ncbi:MAG: lipopolysaccharide heptosyltransferase I [Campylobacteraceae bacterium]|nr:lipopolysaccharide heptosyltransferase I [Campylobacteraceae bacterium]
MRIAIIKLSAMGDIIHAMVALQYIKKYDKNIIIDWFVEKAFKAVLDNNPDIDNIIEINLKQIKKEKLSIFSEIKKIKSYRKNNYDLVIDAQGLIKSAFVAKLLAKNIAGFSKTSIREGLASYFYTKKVEIAYDENTIDRNTKVLSNPLGFEITSKDILDKKSFLFYKNEDKIIYDYLDKDKKNIIFIISSTWESRNYPKEKFANLANKLKENILVVWANEEEKEKALWIEDNSSYVKVMPRINLNSLKALIGKSDLLIGNDTGPTHMAWALNIPSITIFGPTPINRVYITDINKVIKSSSKVNHYKLNKNDFSINEIKEENILKIAKDILD